jgi:hypothetical protein
MGRDRAGADLEQLLAERGSSLMAAAIALAGSRPDGEDLLQAALERVLRKPRQVDGDVEGYLRRVLYNLAADGWRRAAYPVRTQWHTPLTGGPDWPNPALTCENAGFSYPDWQQGIRKALSCHLFTLGGYQKVNGIDALKLVRRFQGGSIVTMWVDPTTYLPVRVASGFPGSSGQRIVETDNLGWLSPTAANRATVHAAEQRGAIPASFKSLPRTYFPLVLVNQPGLPG